MSFINFIRQKQLISEEFFKLLEAKKDMSISDICELLITIENLKEYDIDKIKAEYFNLEYTDLTNFELIDNMNYDFLKNTNSIPFEISNKTAHIAISDPQDIYISNILNSCLASCDKTSNLNKKYYLTSKNNIQDKFQEITNSTNNIFDKILSSAIKSNASDIHITPYEKTVEIMFRIDGELTNFTHFNVADFQSFSISIKVLTKMDISETRRAQSGRFQKNNIDFRIATHPTIYGENIVIRILNKNKSFISIEQLGFSSKQIMLLKKITAFANGMIVFCGPTGSGKTTSIYSILETLDKRSRNIITLEDPVEYKIQHVKQTEIKKGVIDFTDGIRSILRQDPDIILIGEIRDDETAKMAIRASMTGHLVLTTLHSNNSFSAITRLKELGISPTLIIDNIIAIVSQRLVKKISGGRTIISEIMLIDDEIDNMICSNATKKTIYEYAKNNLQFKSLYDDCLDKFNQGIIEKQEMMNVLRIM